MQLTRGLGLVLLLAVACSDPAPEGQVPCRVAGVLAAKCLRCHGDPPRHGAPYRFTSLRELREVRGGKAVYERVGLAVEAGYMPPLELRDDPPVEPLTLGEHALLVDWASAGAPSGDACP